MSLISILRNQISEILTDSARVTYLWKQKIGLYLNLLTFCSSQTTPPCSRTKLCSGFQHTIHEGVQYGFKSNITMTMASLHTRRFCKVITTFLNFRYPCKENLFSNGLCKTYLLLNSKSSWKTIRFAPFLERPHEQDQQKGRFIPTTSRKVMHTDLFLLAFSF